MKSHCRNLFQNLAPILLVVVAVLSFSTAQTIASEQKTDSASVSKKLDPQLVLALKKSRGEPPFDKPGSVEPNIPYQHNGRVLVDIQAAVSTGLMTQIARSGGWVDHRSATTTSLCAMISFSQFENLAARADVKSISPAHPTLKSGVKNSSAH